MKIPHEFDFDPTYGYSLEDLLSVSAPPAPRDFDAFWRQKHEEARNIPLDLNRREIDSPQSGVRLYEIEYTSYHHLRIGAWLTVPDTDRPPACGAVFGHGYGGREEPVFDHPFENGACIFPCMRGFHRSARPDIPNTGQTHVLHGIEHRDTYSHLGSVIDTWLAASVLLDLYPETAERLYYSGGSFGGGIGALALPWDPRFAKAYLNIPSFGNHPLRVTLPCEGSGKAVKQRYDAGDPDLLNVLAYFDAATAASRIAIPVFVAAATFDPSVPPPGQFAVYNALRGEKDLYLRQAAHFELAGNEHDDAAIEARLRRWFAD